MLKNLKYFLLILAVVSCTPDVQESSSTSDRPVETWVFRSVLDEQPRMLVAALHKDLYVAYNTSMGKMYKAWKGIVNFQGAVYDGAHGPQPTSVGDAYILDESSEGVWSVSKGDDQLDHELNYKGHRFKGDVLILQYDLLVDGAEAIHIREAVDYKLSETGQLILYRDFNVSGGDGMTVTWEGEAVLVDKAQLASVENIRFGEGESISRGQKNFIKYPISLELNSGSNPLALPLLEPVFLDPNIDDGFASDASDLPRGAVLIGKNDCKTCHNVSKKTVGPSYMDVAKRYEHNAENVVMLANKIKSGGSGIWGEQVMTAHPEIPAADLKEMVSYIFTTAEFEGESSKKEDSGVMLAAVELDESSLIPGAMTLVYDIEKNLQAMPGNLDNAQPIQAGILPNFNNISGGDFKELEDNFAIVAKGVIKIEESGGYGFRLWSDDGSKLYIHGNQVIDNDGLHGTEMKQCNLTFKKVIILSELSSFRAVAENFCHSI